MVRESGISATKPIFSTYLLPSFKLPFSRRHSASSSSSDGDRSGSSATTTPANSPPNRTTLTKNASGKRISRIAPDTLRCSACSADFGFASQIISKGFTGRYGRAFLVAPPPRPAPQTLPNIRVGKSENRQLVTGWHVVADITCTTCASKLGWKYVDAKEPSQKYKVGKFILEKERVMTYRSWEDVPVGFMEESDLDLDLDSDEDEEGEDEDERHKVEQDKKDGEEIVFDSDDEEQCEEIFAGVWSAARVAKRRKQMVARRKPTEE